MSLLDKSMIYETIKFGPALLKINKEIGSIVSLVFKGKELLTYKLSDSNFGISMLFNNGNRENANISCFNNGPESFKKSYGSDISGRYIEMIFEGSVPEYSLKTEFRIRLYGVDKNGNVLLSLKTIIIESDGNELDKVVGIAGSLRLFGSEGDMVVWAPVKVFAKRNYYKTDRFKHQKLQLNYLDPRLSHPYRFQYEKENRLTMPLIQIEQRNTPLRISMWTSMNTPANIVLTSDEKNLSTEIMTRVSFMKGAPNRTRICENTYYIYIGEHEWKVPIYKYSNDVYPDYQLSEVA